MELKPSVLTIIAILVMLLLFVSFLIAFILSQRKKLQYHKDLQALHDDQQQMLVQQNILLEKRVSERTSELIQQKQNLQDALNDLEASQLLLIQKEKMASLGELTAGIAHEIQNPLNFINNFSDVNKELIEELKEELAKGNQQSDSYQAVVDIANNIKENGEKINNHGRRADAIVKGMLQHSRSGTAEKELTDINALANEFLKLSYHGLRAKDKDFNATMLTDFDSSIQKIKIVPQEIGRVLLNLYNNAFYAVMQKKKNPQLLKGSNEYEPTVWVNTSVTTPSGGKGAIEIKIRDNGTGIPEKKIDKIFQPFFTTKPTGQGTGLGLSLSYDIIKSHGGKISVQSQEGEYTEFTVYLPAS